MATALYRLVAATLGGAVAVFFRQIHVVGTENVPDADRPVVFAGNHPNSLIDPALIVATAGRAVQFAAKDKLFRFPMSVILRALGAVPIARKMDHAGDAPRDNTDSLASMVEALVRGGAIGIFPEGLSHDASHLQRLRTGAARIALEAADRGADACIVPVGLTYLHRKRFRSRAVVQYGAPILAADDLARWRADPREGAAALTARVEAGIRALTINATDWETLRVLDGVRRLYQPRHIPLDHRVELARRFAEVYPTIASDAEVRALYARVSNYLDALDDSGLTDRDVVRGLDGSAIRRRAVASLTLLLVWSPLAIPGALIHAPLGLLVGWAGTTFAPRKDAIGTTKLMVGAVGAAAFTLALPIAALALWGPLAALTAAVAIPLSGIATLKVLERGASLRRLWRGARAATALGRRAEALARERADLERDVVAAVGRHKPAEMVALYPRGV